MPQKKRLQEVVQRLYEEMNTLQQRVISVKQQLAAFEYVLHGTPNEPADDGKPRRVLSVKARKAIAKAQRARWARQKQGKHASNGSRNGASNGESPAHTAARARNSSVPDWSPNEDKRVINLITKKGPVDASEISHILEKKLRHRTHGAIRQRIIRLAKRGLIVEKKGEGVSHIVEAV